MKSLHSPILLALLLVPWAWGPAGGRQAPKAMLKSGCDVAGCDAANAARGACGSSQGYPKVKPESDFPWISAYVPIRSCHRVLKDKYGEFSPPMYHGDSPRDFWCNWTIWAGSKQHIIIYIQGFITTEDCNKNEDKILFEGVSSLVENSVVYACWKKEMQVFATFAQAVHVVLLKRYLPNCRDTQFKGKYYIFQDQKGESFSKDDIFETPAPKLPKQDGIFQSGWAKDLSVLGFVATHSTVNPGRTMVLSGGLLQGRGSMLDATTVGSPVELVPYEDARKPLLERKAPCVLLPEQIGGLRLCKEAQGRGIPEGIIPAAKQDTWSKSLSMSGDITVGFDYTHRLSSLLLKTPLLGDLQEIEPLLQPADVGLENRQSVLHPTLKPKDLGDLQFTIKPAHTSCPDLAALSQALSPGRRDSKENTGISMYQWLSTVSLEKDESHVKMSVTVDDTTSRDADGLAKGLMPSLSSPYELVNGDHLQLLPERSQRCQSSSGDLSLTQPELGTTGLQPTKLIGISSPECFRGGVEGKIVLHPTATWDILQEHPSLYGQSSHVPHSSPIDPGSLPQNSQACDCPSVKKAHASSLSVKSCHYQSDRAAQPGLAVTPLPTGLEHASTDMFTLGTEKNPVLVVSCTEPVPMDFGYTDFSPKTFNPAVEPPSSIIFSPPAALDLDPVHPRQGVDVLLASSGEQEMVSSSLPLYPLVTSELAKDESHRCLGMQKLEQGQVGGQQGGASAPMHLPAGGLSPASVTEPIPGVGLSQPEEHESSGTGVVPSFLPGTWGVRREKHVVPVQHQSISASNKLASASNLRGFKMKKTPESLQEGAGEQRIASSSAIPAHPAPMAWGGERVSRGQKSQELSDDSVSRNTQIPGGQQQKHAELGLPWAMEYFPVRSCHIVLQDGSGMFYLPLHADIKDNIWCNWTIWAGPQKHIVVYVQGFQGSEGCGKNQDKIIFHGVSSSVETKVVYACHNRGTLIFATRATAVNVLFLSGTGFQSSGYGHFKGWYYVFRDPEAVGSSNDSKALQEPVQEVSKKERWRMAVTKGLLPRLRASLGPSAVPAGGRIQTELVSPDEEAQHPQNLLEEIQSGANLSKQSQLWDETKLERNLKDSGTEGKETRDVLVEPATTGYKTEPSALEIAKSSEELVSVLDAAVTNCSVDISSSMLPRSTVGAPAKSSSLDQTSNSLSEEVFAAAHHTQTPVPEELLLNTNTKPPLYTFPGVTPGGTVSLGKRNEELFDLLSALASQENDTLLQSQHHPGDVLLEVTIEIKPKDWILHGGSELQKGLLESLKSRVQENLKLSANRINEIKLKKIERMSSANLLFTFWLHLKPEKNVSLLLHSQLEELLGTSVGVEKLQFVSLFVEDVNECNTGVSLCGEEAECFNGVGTYLCRCKKDYEDHSPTKSGTLCVRAPQSGINFFLRHADILVGAAITAAVAMLVAAGALCRAARQRRHPGRNLSPEEPPVRAVEEPAMELHDLGECLQLDPFRLKLRARPPEWLWGARVHSSQAYQVFLEQSPQL